LSPVSASAAASSSTTCELLELEVAVLETVPVAVLDELLADEPVDVAVPVAVAVAAFVAEPVESFELVAEPELDAADIAATDVGSASPELMPVELPGLVGPGTTEAPEPVDVPGAVPCVARSKVTVSRPHAETRPQTAPARHRIFNDFMATQAPLGSRLREYIETPR
jgi:hypothetical protein